MEDHNADSLVDDTLFDAAREKDVEQLLLVKRCTHEKFQICFLDSHGHNKTIYARHPPGGQEVGGWNLGVGASSR
eukprot:4646603-Amphidinium_carterae.1